jgi:CSLREA domain-containing protein
LLKYSRIFPIALNVFMVLSLLLGSALTVTPVYAATFTVTKTADTNDGTCGADCSLREAITAANAAAGADTITLPAGIYTLTFGGQLPAVTGAIIINGSGAVNTIVEASTCNPVTLPGGCTPATYRVFEVASTGGLTLNSLTVRNGRCNGSCVNGADSGGGILNGGALIVSNVTFSANSATSGGGMYNTTSCSSTLTNVTFSANFATSGGGMYNNTGSSPTLTNVTFSANSAAGGGGMYNNGNSPTLTDVTFSANNAFSGGGMLNAGSSPTLTNVTFSTNSANDGGGMFNYVASSPTLTNVTFSANSATSGGGMSNDSNSSPMLTDVTFSANSADYGGGMYNTSYTSPTLTNVTFSANSATYIGGGMWNNGSNSALTNVTFSANSAQEGGGMYNIGGSQTLTNVTFSANSAAPYQGGGMYNTGGSQTLTNVTFSANSAAEGGGIYNSGSSPTLKNTLIANSASGGDCVGTLNAASSNNLIEDNANACGLTNGANGNIIGSDPNLGTLAGSPAYFPLNVGSPAINAGDDTICAAAPVNNTSQNGVTRPQGPHCDIGSFESGPVVDVSMAGTNEGSYVLLPGASTRQSYSGINDGPVKVNSDGATIIASERVIYTVAGSATSFSEMMALPASQLNTTYWLPWYNNVDLDTQLRFGNVSGLPASVHVYIGGTEVSGSPFALTASGAGQSTRLSFPGINNGPVQIVSDQQIVAAERVIYNVGGLGTSFSEMMALPNSQLSTTYWLPWYNNVDLDTQLRIGNVSGVPAEVHVYIGGVEMTGSPFALTASGAGQSTRVSFAGINNGPVQIVSDQQIVAAERVIYTVAGSATSFSEMMALPNGQINTTYWMPWYNNVDLDTQLRIGNVSGVPASVHVYIGGVEMTGSPFALTASGAGQSTRLSFAGVNNGPVQIVSDQNIVAAERVIYTVGGLPTSFSEMMGLSNDLLDATYWLPWYNNVDLDTQLRFGVP